jgi:hypothetical protein
MGTDIVSFLYRAKDPTEFILSALGAIGGVIIIKEFGYDQWRRMRRARFLFGREVEKTLCIGSEKVDKTLRSSDMTSLAILRGKWPSRKDKDQVNITTPSAFKDRDLNELPGEGPILLIGSTRYNSFVGQIQNQVTSPLILENKDPFVSGDNDILAIQYKSNRNGQPIDELFFCSWDSPLSTNAKKENDTRDTKLFDYGIVLVGELPVRGGTQHILWIGGIHGTGTIGAAKWLANNVKRYDWKKADKKNPLGGTCYLIKTFCDSKGAEKPASLETKLEYGPLEWTPHKGFTEPHGQDDGSRPIITEPSNTGK